MKTTARLLLVLAALAAAPACSPADAATFVQNSPPSKVGAMVFGNYVTSSYVTKQIDWVSGTSVTLIPAQSGYAAANVGMRIVMSAASGTYTTTVTAKAGNNGTNDNILASTAAIPTTASFTAAVSANTFPFCATSYVIQVSSVPFVDLATPVTYVITQAAVGASLVLKGHIIVTYTAVPLSALQ